MSRHIELNLRSLSTRGFSAFVAAVIVTLAALLASPARVSAAPAVAPHEVAPAHEAVAPHAAADAHGEHGDSASALTKPDLVALIFTIVVFVALVLVLRATAWNPILKGLKAREDSIRNSIEAAAKAKADAERTTRELEAKMAEVQRQSAAQLTQAKADALKLAEGIKAQAEAESAALKDRTLRDIEAAKTQALSEINSHAADLGIAVARKILQRQITVEDQGRLVEESLAQLGTSKM